MSNSDLQRYFGFDEADLYANRSHVLTSKRKKRMIENAKFTNKVFLFAGLAIIIAGILIGVFLFFTITQIIFTISFGVMVLVISVIVGIGVIRMGSRSREDFDLKSVEGRINIIKEDNYTTKPPTTDYELHIGGVTFDVESDLADIMMQGDSYAIYYLKGAKEIVSAEKIKPEK